jgi:Tfp pilus assembly protein PilW
MKKQRGLSLIELMISLALGMIVIGGVTYVTASTMRTNSDTLRSTHLNQELRAALQMMTRDLRRSGYRFGIEQASVFTSNFGLTLSATSGTITLTPSDGSFGEWMTGARVRHLNDGVSYCIDITTNSSSSAEGTFVDCDANTDPAAFPSTTVSAGTWTIQDANGLISTTATCVSMGYDRDEEVTDNPTGDGDIESDEQVGYAYDATNKALLVGSTGANCASGTSGWDALINTDESGIDITGLDVDIIGDNEINAGNATVRMLEIQLSLSGQLTTDSTVQRTVTEVVKVRNDQLI